MADEWRERVWAAVEYAMDRDIKGREVKHEAAECVAEYLRRVVLADDDGRE